MMNNNYIIGGQRPRIGLSYFIIFLLSVSSVIIVYTLPFSENAYFRLDHFVWLLIFIPAFLKGTFSRHNFVKYSSVKPLIIFCLICLFSTVSIFATKVMKLNVYNSLWYQIAMYQGAIVYLIALSCFPIERRETFIKWIIFLGVGLSIVGLMQFLTVIPPYAYNPRMVIPDNRATGLLSYNNNHLGAYLIASIFFGYGYIIQNKNIMRKIIGLIAVIFMILVLIMTKCRSAWVGFLMGNIIYGFVNLRVTKGKSLIFIIMIALVLSTSIFYMPNVQNVLHEGAYERSGSAYSRLSSYDLFFNYLTGHPLVLITGVGFMNWRYALSHSTAASEAHDMYLELLGELGIGGLLVFLWFWYRNFKMARTLAQNGDFWARMFIPIIGAYLTTCLTYDILYPVWAMENFFFFSMLITGVILCPYDAEITNFPVEKAGS